MEASEASPLARRLAVFTMERFPPLAYGPLIVAFASCGSVGAAAASGRSLSPVGLVAAVLIVTLGFFRMRLLDDVKDAEVDRLGRPWRPVPRGLVSVRELRVGSNVALLLMGATAALLGPAALGACLVAGAFAVMAGEDFFAGGWLRERALLYALVHSPAVPLLMLASWAAQPGASVAPALAWLLLLAWSASLGIEFGRKTHAASEERPFVDTYSARLGPARAVLVAAACLALGALAVAGYAGSLALPSWSQWLGLAGAVGILLSWPLLRHARGRIIAGWASATTLALLAVPTVATLAGSSVRLGWWNP